MRGLCGTCGRSRRLIAGLLPPHDNLALRPCSGKDRPPLAPSPAEVTAGQALEAAGAVLEALPAAGLVLAGGAR